MQYNLGMYGGSFNPLHMGHVKCITKASLMCKKLLIVISDTGKPSDIDVLVKYRWIYNVTKHLRNVSIMILKDSSESKEAYSVEMAMEDSKLVKEFAGEKIDVVFCGSDYSEESFWNKCYPDADFYVFERDGISSTAIRENPLAHWDELPVAVRPYYVKKVLIIGSESTGKSTLTINLAHYFNTNYIEEAGREISVRSGDDDKMLPGDFTEILMTQKMMEIKAIEQSNRVLFEDTDCLTTYFYLGFWNDGDKGPNGTLAKAIDGLNDYDLILFLEPDVEFVNIDNDRNVEIEREREKYSEKLKAILKETGRSFHSVSGDYEERFNTAVELVKKMM